MSPRRTAVVSAGGLIPAAFVALGLADSRLGVAAIILTAVGAGIPGSLATLALLSLRTGRRSSGTPRTSAAPGTTGLQDHALAVRDLVDVGATQWHTGLPVPPLNLRFMAEPPERYLATGRELATAVLGAAPNAPFDVLDVGSGYGRLAVGLMGAADSRLHSYLGFDVLERHVRWCTLCLTTADNRFAFRHLDVRNDRYNPNGKINADEVRFPAGDESVDVVALFSVFTHLYLADAVRYLSECARVLRPGGKVVSSWLLFDNARLPAVTSQSATYPLVHLRSDGSRFMDESDPLRAIGFEQELVLSEIKRAGLEDEAVVRGTWSGEAPGGPDAMFQDLLVARRPG